MIERRMGRAATVAMTIACMAGAILSSGTALAQDYPVRTVHVVVPFPAGGGADFMGREIARKLQQKLKESFVVDNKSGASGMLGTQAVMQSKPDGYTLLLGTTGTHSTNFATIPGISYHPLNDFETVSIFADAPFLLCVNRDVPVTNLKELAAYAKANPGKLSHGSSGNGSSAHLGFEALKAALGVSIVHVPYKGLPPAMVDTIGGHISMTMDSIPSASPHIKSGRVRCIATGGRQRSPVFPDIPTIAESGVPGFSIGSWYGLFAPKGTPASILQKLSGAVQESLNDDDMRTALAQVGADGLPMTPAESRKYLEDDIARWVKVANDLNIKVTQ
ncbi:MAG: tripartite tricarboxylate transporter substrate binding protein [Ideonella sp.]